MGISEKKMQIVINNYFKQECDVNTSIREAFEKGFRIGVKKGQSAQSYALDEWCDTCKEYDSERNCCPRWNRVIRDALKEIQPMRKGVEFDSNEDKYDMIKCPHCKHIFTVDSYHWTDIGFVKDDFKFCPNCGADMRGGQDE